MGYSQMLYSYPLYDTQVSEKFGPTSSHLVDGRTAYVQPYSRFLDAQSRPMRSFHPPQVLPRVIALHDESGLVFHVVVR